MDEDVLLLSVSTCVFVPDLVVPRDVVAVDLRPIVASFVPIFDLLFDLELEAEIADELLDPPPLLTFVSVDLLFP